MQRQEFVPGLLALARCSLDWDDLHEARDSRREGAPDRRGDGRRARPAAARVLSLQAVACAPEGADVARLELAAVAVRRPDGFRQLVAPMLSACGCGSPALPAPPQRRQARSSRSRSPETRFGHDDVPAALELLESVIGSRGVPKATVVEAAVLLSITAERQESDDDARRWESSWHSTSPNRTRSGDRSPTRGVRRAKSSAERSGRELPTVGWQARCWPCWTAERLHTAIGRASCSIRSAHARRSCCATSDVALEPGDRRRALRLRQHREDTFEEHLQEARGFRPARGGTAGA